MTSDPMVRSLQAFRRGEQKRNDKGSEDTDTHTRRDGLPLQPGPPAGRCGQGTHRMRRPLYGSVEMALSTFCEDGVAEVANVAAFRDGPWDTACGAGLLAAAAEAGRCSEADRGAADGDVALRPAAAAAAALRSEGGSGVAAAAAAAALAVEREDAEVTGLAVRAESAVDAAACAARAFDGPADDGASRWQWEGKEETKEAERGKKEGTDALVSVSASVSVSAPSRSPSPPQHGKKRRPGKHRRRVPYARDGGGVVAGRRLGLARRCACGALLCPPQLHVALELGKALLGGLHLRQQARFWRKGECGAKQWAADSVNGHTVSKRRRGRGSMGRGGRRATGRRRVRRETGDDVHSAALKEKGDREGEGEGEGEGRRARKERAKKKELSPSSSASLSPSSAAAGAPSSAASSSAASPSSAAMSRSTLSSSSSIARQTGRRRRCDGRKRMRRARWLAWRDCALCGTVSDSAFARHTGLFSRTKERRKKKAAKGKRRERGQTEIWRALPLSPLYTLTHLFSSALLQCAHTSTCKAPRGLRKSASQRRRIRN